MSGQTSSRRSLPLSLALLVGALATVFIFTWAGFAPSTAQTPEPFGFWGGVQHGSLIFGALIFSCFDETFALVAAHHSGWTYNIGFYVGVSLWFVVITNLQGAVKAGFQQVEEAHFEEDG